MTAHAAGGLTPRMAVPHIAAMLPTTSWILTEDFAGLRSQALGLAEAAGLSPATRTVRPRGLWRHLAPAFWPAPLRAVAADGIAPPLPEIIIGCGGKAAAVLAALRHRTRGVIIQHPRISTARFDLIIAGRHDELTGPNVLVTRTAIHRVTKARLDAAATLWAPRFANLKRPLVAVLVGGSNGRFTLGTTTAGALAGQLAEMTRRDGVGLVLTPSRRTDPAVTTILRDALLPLGAEIWDGTDENPYFGMLALADAIIVTVDSVSMLSEAVATSAPVMAVALPGKSRRIGLFLKNLIDDGRVRPYQGRLETWPVVPIDDTQATAAELRRRFGY